VSNASTSPSKTMDLLLGADALSTELLRSLSVMTLGKPRMPEKKISFTVWGKVVGKGRPHFVRKTGVALTPQRTRSYESVIRDAAFREMAWEPWDAPVVAIIRAYYEIPKSWSKAKKELAQHQLVAPSKPDVDNIVKIVLDACNRTVYLDDTQVVLCISQKLWGDTARLEVEFAEV
jgi:Holliday junction resolvase RusA-like endonuclease